MLPGGPRAFHAGLRLADGRILLTGGCSELTKGLCAAGRLQASVAVYDPKRDAFTSGLPLLVARAWHRAILRDDGLVLIVGGLGDAGQALPPELYDPDEARGTTLVGPAGSSVVTPGGMVTTLNDGGSAGDRVLGWSGRDEAPVAITQLASPRSDVTLTALEDGAVLFAGGREGQNLASTSVIVGPSGESELVAGFAAQGHTATRLHDGTVLLAGGIDATRRAGATSVVFLRSLTGPFDTPSTLTFDGPLALSPSRPGSVRVEGGALTVGAGSKPPRAVESYAVVPGPELAGPSAAGFSLSFLAGVEGDAEAAVIFGDPAASRYVAVVFAAGSSPRLLSVTPDRPGLPVVQEAVGCEAAPVDPAELPIVGTAPLTVTMRQGRIALTSAARTLLACGGQAAPPRGAIALGARTRSSGGVARFDNVQLGR